MNTTDIERIHAAGLITAEQRDRIVAHFGMKDEGARFLIIVSFIGAVLVAAGIALLIGAHWNEIPCGVKLAGGLALLLGAHGGGWWLRDARQDYPKTGEALHFAGSLLWLANIALVGQTYHLSSRPGNAFLLWWVGIAALPWLLRSAAQFALLLLAIGIWFGVEINDRTSLLLCDDEHQVLAYALLGLMFTGFGFVLRRGADKNFAVVAETIGLLAFVIFFYPLTWAGFWGWNHRPEELCPWLFPTLGALAVLLTALGCRNLAGLTRQWRTTFGLALAGAAALLVGAYYVPQRNDWYWFGHMTPLNTIAAIAFFIYCLLQVQVGVQARSRFLVNLGVLFIALDILATYIGLFGSMAFTGLMFVMSGLCLIVFAVFLERKWRSWMKQIKCQPEAHP